MRMTAKQRGLWPETTPAFHLSPTVSVTFRIDSTLYDWLADFVGGYSFFSNVEEALTTAVRCMAGADHPHGCDMQSLAYWVSDAKGQPLETAMYRRISPASDHGKILALLYAAHIAAVGVDIAMLSDEPDFAATVERVLTAVGLDTDLSASEPDEGLRVRDSDPNREI